MAYWLWPAETSCGVFERSAFWGHVARGLGLVEDV